MNEERTYLELSEEGGSAHKFYEVVVRDKTLTIRYGRIGDAGQSKVSELASPEAARAEAKKKIAEKTRKGYAEAVQGGRKKRVSTRREIVSHKSSASHVAPVLWKFSSGERAFGIFVDESRCWLGNEAGSIFALDHQGKVLEQYRLPDGVKSIVADDLWLYAGCDDGGVYDLGGKIPRVAYQVADHVDIFWLDIKDGLLAVSDALGNVAVFNHEDESQWHKKSQGTSGWMVRCDELGVYHGHSEGLTMYDAEDGTELWHQKTKGPVLFGWQEESSLFAGTAANQVHRFSKRGGGERLFLCDAAVFSCASAEDGKYVFAGDNCSTVYCFDGQSGERLWKLSTGCGSAYSMQFFQDRLYMVTTEGALACMDASEAAIASAKSGAVPVVRDIKAPAPVAAIAPGTLETTRSAASGVVVECYLAGTHLRVRAVSAGFNPDWAVQFPKDIRVEGARYVVDQLRASARGEFYRALGQIRRLAD